MLLKHVYMDWKFQRILEFDISFSLEHFFISVAIFTQVASAPLMFYLHFCETFMKAMQKQEKAFRTLLNIYDEASMRRQLMTVICQLFLDKSSILDVWQGPKYASNSCQGKSLNNLIK